MFFIATEIGETESCSSPKSCKEKSVPKCHCYEECTGSLTPVCGTDGIMYDGMCELKMAACSADAVIDVTVDSFCEMVTKGEDTCVCQSASRPIEMLNLPKHIKRV